MYEQTKEVIFIWIQKDKKFNHHIAIEKIIKFKNDVGKHLYVSECDIKKFYDCVNQDIIIDSFNSKVNELKKKGIEVNQRAIDLFYSYLYVLQLFRG